ncbi:response regulator [Nonomuraea sp. NPDC026600]|uniref:ANTAR domain-containing response regulator n=1 Tax=Nonomuraea sp. NPDC026600 TaxID=3155363 RepID=UPI0033EFF3D7
MKAAPQILIVEDEPLLRLDLAEMLTDDGYQVVGEAGDGETAVYLARQLHPDIVIMDIKLPIRDGISAAAQIHAERLAPVMFLTAFSQRDLVDKARDAGGYAYLVKPFTMADLRPAIDLVLARHAERRALDQLNSGGEGRSTVSQAEGYLNGRFGLSMDRGLAWLQDVAINQRMQISQVAAEVVAGNVVRGADGMPVLATTQTDPEAITVDAYLATDDEQAARQVFEALDAFCRAVGYAYVEQNSLERGSFWRRARAVVAEWLRSPEIRERMIKAERALELVALDAHQAEVDGKVAEAVSTLVASLADIPEACLRVGSILLIKHEAEGRPVLVTRTLSQVEIRTLERFPEIQKYPRTVLASLATAIASLNVDEAASAEP